MADTRAHSDGFNRISPSPLRLAWIASLRSTVIHGIIPEVPRTVKSHSVISVFTPKSAFISSLDIQSLSPDMSPYRPNPFFATTNAVFLPSIGDRIDGAIAETKQFAKDAQAKTNELYTKADMKYQDAKEAVKDSQADLPTGVDLYSRYVAIGNT